jgi:hypothetical protein
MTKILKKLTVASKINQTRSALFEKNQIERAEIFCISKMLLLTKIKDIDHHAPLALQDNARYKSEYFHDIFPILNRLKIEITTNSSKSNNSPIKLPPFINRLRNEQLDLIMNSVDVWASTAGLYAFPEYAEKTARIWSMLCDSTCDIDAALLEISRRESALEEWGYDNSDCFIFSAMKSYRDVIVEIPPSIRRLLSTHQVS